MPGTTLGQAVRAARGDESLVEVAKRLGLSHPTLSRIERGTHAPSIATALALSKWLGWSLEDVVRAASEPAPSPTDTPAEGSGA